MEVARAKRESDRNQGKTRVKLPLNANLITV